MTVKLDKVQDASIRQDVNGITVVRHASLSGITGPAHLRQRSALMAPGLPRFGDPHPAFPRIKVVDIDISPIDVDRFEAQITYREPTETEKVGFLPDGSVVERTWFAVTVTEERAFDADGDPMYHFYTGYPIAPQIIGGSVFYAPTTSRQIAVKAERASVQTPSVGQRVKLVEAHSAEQRLGYFGHVNKSRWGKYPAKTWLLGGLDSRMEQGRWQNEYLLYYNRESWRFKSTVDWAGTVPSDVTEGNGIAYFDVYPTANFSQIGFKPS